MPQHDIDPALGDDPGGHELDSETLNSADLELVGRIRTASNATYLASIRGTKVIYKPLSGERPLWDFPDGNLAGREVAAYLVSQAFDWDVVPLTWLRDGPAGEGMVQLWQDCAPEQTVVDLVAADAIPDSGWRHVLDGNDENDRTVSLIHEDSAALRRMAVFDIIVNNADRKGAHVLPMADRHRHGCDHGLTFHTEHKLRTVLWGWVGVHLAADELAGIARVRAALDAELGGELSSHLTEPEIAALVQRCDELQSVAHFPEPRGPMPAVPWPLF